MFLVKISTADAQRPCDMYPFCVRLKKINLKKKPKTATKGTHIYEMRAHAFAPDLGKVEF